MRDFEDMHQQLISRFGSAKAVQGHLIEPLSESALSAASDNFYLSNMSRRVFRAGLKHSLVDAKWPAFEQAFFNFSPLRVAMMSDEELDELMANKAIIRHWGKIKAMRVNAYMVYELSEQHQGFGRWLAQWPVDDIVGLWLLLKKQGAQLGGNSAASFLRMVGKDTFVLSADVIAALISQDIVAKAPTSQRDLRAVQYAFNQWREQSGWPLCKLSRMLAMTVNY
ncbi:DNA-3-methyladenine glycosylase I [Dasania sp. GY-MA-18]|uniref:DNA-3-methyladenine glycosylase I n=1 Tax=Dasania phycosphaerae TaxID=2950436 RepID=A0A9J6RRH1_9GAMM|nr:MULTISPECIES: DNA-3-methyladenine glycosylase I [Dasania]MCR8924301.1 DNA-3-methyladenine glycosylase I [Dasania sp. GY-MA-18]MCZ0866954.1 DNA-3-methyladenine glycosylase I [Dasania phycosphaerae]MCZ0870458.1 DNA-3-methyladenine glycosylase I [Dasania phycosphaerae]